MSAARDELAVVRQALAAAAALRAADQLGVLERLGGAGADAVELAHACGLDERGARQLLAALGSLGVVARDSDGAYRIASGEPARTRALLRRWNALPAALRGVAGSASDEAGDPELLAALGAEAVERLESRLIPAAGDILDLSADAAFVLGYTRGAPAVRVSTRDRPRVREQVAVAAQEGRFTFLPDDPADSAATYDRALLCFGCQQRGPEANRRLFGHLFDRLRPGGALLLLELLPNERLDGPRAAILYALDLVAQGGSGCLYPFSSYASWLRDAGFEAIERLNPHLPLPVELIAARRPGEPEEA
ncbi:MAG TPA: hypothetical protein VFI42_13780 [Thermomicrobiaceae bacterium]|nr:hypothetical protein [Thermomicrobiaceae bacterium]